MLNLILVSCPPPKNNQSNRAKKLRLFNHYLNHKLDSNKSVLEHIIYSFNKQYKPEIYYFNLQQIQK